MNDRSPQAGLKVLLKELDAKGRRVALRACRAYKDQEVQKVWAQIRTEFLERKRRAKYTIQILKKLVKKLREMESLNADTKENWYDVLRDVHIPFGSPALLPIYEQEPTLEDYYRIMELRDPAKPFLALSKSQREISNLAQEEIAFLERWPDTLKSPARTSIPLFAKRGAFEYALKHLFDTRTSIKLKEKEIEVRIAKIRVRLEGGGLNIDPDRNDCAAIRMAIRRLQPKYKIWCNTFLSHQLG